ncbi:hypothetical protein NFI96_016559 [Prochilodus magdalenae]|nr:hypothetical protein NFI96_016559 [Prochilodus magdalenae]
MIHLHVSMVSSNILYQVLLNWEEIQLCSVQYSQIRLQNTRVSSETDSSTQSCVYKLPKRNLSLSDAGTYYCAVLMCGEIILGNGTKLDFVGNDVLFPIILGLAASNLISMAVILFLGRKLLTGRHKGRFNSETDMIGSGDEALNYAALSFTNKPASSRGTRRQQQLKHTDVYSQIKYPQ